MVTILVLRKPKTTKQVHFRKSISSIHFLIMGGTILDVTFYSCIQLTKGFTESASIAVISLFICLASTAFLAFDLFNFIAPIYRITIKKYKVREEGYTSLVARSITTPEAIYVASGYKSTKSRLIRSVNPLYVVRFMISQYFIALCQDMPGVQVYGLFLTNVSFALFMIIILFKNKRYLKNPAELWIKLIVETLLIIFLVCMVIFHHDPDGIRYSSKTREILEIIGIVCTCLIALIQSIKLLYGLKKELIEKSQAQAEADENNATKKLRNDVEANRRVNPDQY